jgi:formylglycine-generating enzyme required for sulfatase activity
MSARKPLSWSIPPRPLASPLLGARLGATALAGALAAAALGCNAGHAAPREEPTPRATSDASERKPETTRAEPAPVASAAPPQVDACAKVSCGPLERCEGGACTSACPAGEVYVPPTPAEGFVMGGGLMMTSHPERLTKGHQPNSDRPHQVVLTKPFCMDATEVTVEAYEACVNERGCTLPSRARRFMMYPSKKRHPVNVVDWKQARHFCQSLGKSLPTEAQWEWAATGGKPDRYPWGNEEPTCEHADYTAGPLSHPAGDHGCHGGGPSEVASHPKGDKVWPSGHIHDLSGNVWEWTLDNFSSFKEGTVTDPLVTTSEDLPHVVRGGGWNRSHTGILARFRGASRVDYQVPGLGFRCVRNPA